MVGGEGDGVAVVVTTFSATVRNKAAKKRYQLVIARGTIFGRRFFRCLPRARTS